MAVPCTACIQWTKFTHTTVRFLSWEGDDGPGANLFEQEHKTEEGTHQLHNYAEPHLHIKETIYHCQIDIVAGIAVACWESLKTLSLSEITVVKQKL